MGRDSGALKGLNKRFTAARHFLDIFSSARVYRSITSGCPGRTVFEEIRPGAGFETGDFVEEKLGGGYRSKTHILY